MHKLPVLGQITERTVGVPEHVRQPEETYTVRRAVRGLVFNEAGKIAILHAANDGYHKLPGGGVEPVAHDADEDNVTCLRREAMEEIGRDVVVGEAIGRVSEAKDTQRMLQVSDCYFATATGPQREVALTEDEQKAGLTVKWMTLDEALEQLEADAPPSYLGKFIRSRDLLFLRTAKEIVERQIAVRHRMLLALHAGAPSSAAEAL